MVGWLGIHPYGLPPLPSSPHRPAPGSRVQGAPACRCTLQPKPPLAPAAAIPTPNPPTPPPPRAPCPPPSPPWHPHGAGVGHCLHDDKPELVHAELLPWLEGVMGAQCPEVPQAEAAAAAAATPAPAGVEPPASVVVVAAAAEAVTATES